jgi:hypothetical protein
MIKIAISFLSLFAATVIAKEPTLYNSAIKIESSENQVQWKQGDQSWQPMSFSHSLQEKMKVQTGETGTLLLRFGEGSRVKLEESTIIEIKSLHDPKNQPLINLSLEQGEMRVEIAAYDSYRSFLVTTPFSMLIASDGAPTFTVLQKDNLTTLAVKKNGNVTVQVDNPALQSIMVHPGEQISLNASKMGPLVVAGAPPSLEEPKELHYRLLELGQMQECETPEGKKETCGTWSWNREKQQYDATWGDGTKGVLKVQQMSDGKLILNRQDELKGSSVLTAEYTGHDAGTKMIGDVAFQQLEGTVIWHDQGERIQGNWNATSSYFFNLKATSGATE